MPVSYLSFVILTQFVHGMGGVTAGAPLVLFAIITASRETG